MPRKQQENPLLRTAIESIEIAELRMRIAPSLPGTRDHMLMALGELIQARDYLESAIAEARDKIKLRKPPKRAERKNADHKNKPA